MFPRGLDEGAIVVSQRPSRADYVQNIMTYGLVDPVQPVGSV